MRPPLRALASAAGAGALLLTGGHAHAVDEPDQASTWEAEYGKAGRFVGVSCDAMVMPGPSTGVWIDEDDFTSFLDEGNEWISLVLVSGDSVEENLYPKYGDASTNVYSSAGSVIDSIVLCQASQEAPATEPEDDGDDADDGDGAGEAPGPPVETAGPSAAAGPDVGLIGGAALLAGGLGAAGWAVLRRPGTR